MSDQRNQERSPHEAPDLDVANLLGEVAESLRWAEQSVDTLQDVESLLGSGGAAQENRAIRAARSRLAQARAQELQVRTAALRIQFEQLKIRVQRRSALGVPVGREEPAAAGLASLGTSVAQLLEADNVEQRLTQLVCLALTEIDGAAQTAIALLPAHGQLHTRVLSDPLVRAVHELHTECGEGPVLQAVHDGDIVVVPDVGDAVERWPRFAPAAARLGVVALASVPLLTTARGTRGALTVLADRPDGLTDRDVAAAGVFAAQASLLLHGENRDSEQGVEPGVVARAVAFIHANAERDVGLAEIAEASGIGARGLQHAFRKAREVTPTGYLRRVRLERAHQQLQAGDPADGDTVAAIARRWGFTHLSHFSAGYRDRYGCKPSHTLRH